MRPRLCVWSLIVALSACAPNRPETPLAQTGHGSLPPGAAELEAVCGHTFRRPLAVQSVGHERMRKVIAEQVTRHSSDMQAAETFAKAFGFISTDTTVTTSASVDLIVEQIVGIYVPEDHSIYLRDGHHDDARMTQSIVLHEMTHALQSDTF